MTTAVQANSADNNTLENTQISNVSSYNSVPNSQKAPVPGLTTVQCSQLMALLNRQASDVFGGSNDNAHRGFMAGNKFCLLTSLGKTIWVIDSGARDHIKPNLSLLVDIKPIHQYCYITMSNGK